MTTTDKRRFVRRAATIAVAGGVALAALIWLAARLGDFGVPATAVALGLYFGASLIFVARIGDHHPFARIGAANVVTLARLVLTCLFAGVVVQIAEDSLGPTPVAAWAFFVVASLAAALDGIDGPLARRQGLVSDFGSRFDMETDALLILLLSVAALALEKAGAWVLVGGALRYIFIVAGWIWPALARPLPPSLRRKAICVFQSAALALLLTPIITPPVSGLLAFAAFILLVYSFGQDVVGAFRGAASQASQAFRASHG
ncbi:MAG: CDP-alcohol phosphatidyltransferase family protein [Rhodospirillaceae bacterium]|nr:CDP-alcohol phosphatidyltransferase family protein [Rhodospirillaceae bacterium]